MNSVHPLEYFTAKDARKLLRNKFVVIIGDSLQRGNYKDLVCLLQYDRHMTTSEAKKKGEPTHLNDELIEGGRLHNETHYREVRQYQTLYHLVRFYFVTRCYGEYFDTILKDLETGPEPDVVIMNSCLWDMSRYGPSFMGRYQDNIDHLFNQVNSVLPKDTLFMWLTCTPIGSKSRGGFLKDRIQWKMDTMRLDILEANFFSAQAALTHGFEVVDMHRFMRNFLHLRSRDDVHWLPAGNRRITNEILAHVAKLFGFPVPKPDFQKYISLVPAQVGFHAKHNKADIESISDIDNNNNPTFSSLMGPGPSARRSRSISVGDAPMRAMNSNYPIAHPQNDFTNDIFPSEMNNCNNYMRTFQQQNYNHRFGFEKANARHAQRNMSPFNQPRMNNGMNYQSPLGNSCYENGFDNFNNYVFTPWANQQHTNIMRPMQPRLKQYNPYLNCIPQQMYGQGPRLPANRNTVFNNICSWF
ncbi:PC-esterase domain-containing protein 1B-like [Tubulanus polymorphus]|uniref:PC-esterase domain-containing protein 1B-like n=1 Tax=Tubulanus polymorphus TaxID=672921 RepID=UPI003DA45474